MLAAFALPLPVASLAAFRASPAAAPPHPDAALLDLERVVAETDAETERLWLEHEGTGDELAALRDPRMPGAVARVHGALDRMGRSRAHTARGMLVKARVLRHSAEVGQTGYEEGIARSLCDDLERVCSLDGRA